MHGICAVFLVLTVWMVFACSLVDAVEFTSSGTARETESRAFTPCASGSRTVPETAEYPGIDGLAGENVGLASGQKERTHTYA